MEIKKRIEIMENSLEKELVNFLIENEEVSSIDIAKQFLKFQAPNEKMANISVSAILKGIAGCEKNDKGLWFYNKDNVVISTCKLCELSWVVLRVVSSNENIPLCVSMSIPFSEEKSKVFWLVDPEVLDEENQAILRSGNDMQFTSTEETLSLFSKKIKDKIVITENYKEQGIIGKILMDHLYPFPDDSYLLNMLLKSCGIKRSSIDNLYRDFYKEAPVNNSVMERTETFKLVIEKVIEKLNDEGVNTRKDLLRLEYKKSVLAEWGNFQKEMKDIISVSSGPGVYGFTNRDGDYIYIGKASNLQRRLLSYFRISDESPLKLKELRQQAYDLTIYDCGSELESLIYEQRLIKKYQPLLNRKVAYNERCGTYKTINDSVILLPHSENYKLLLCLYRKEQSIKLVPFYKDIESSSFSNLLDEFYFKGKLAPKSSDFEELEIVNRWTGINRDKINIIRVDNFPNGFELFKQIKTEFNTFEFTEK